MHKHLNKWEFKKWICVNTTNKGKCIATSTQIRIFVLQKHPKKKYYKKKKVQNPSKWQLEPHDQGKNSRLEIIHVNKKYKM